MCGGRGEVLGLTRSTQTCLEYADARNPRHITSQCTEDAESPKVHGEAQRTPPAPVSCRLQCRAGAGIVLLTRHHQRRYCAVNEVPSAPVSSRLRGPAGAGVVRSTRPHQRQYRAVNEAPPAPVSYSRQGPVSASIVPLTGPCRRLYQAVYEASLAPVSCGLQGPAGAGIVRLTRPRRRRYCAVYEAVPAPVSYDQRSTRCAPASRVTPPRQSWQPLSLRRPRSFVTPQRLENAEAAAKYVASPEVYNIASCTRTPVLRRRSHSGRRRPGSA